MWQIERSECPECKRANLYLLHLSQLRSGSKQIDAPRPAYELVSRTLVRPKATSRGPIPDEVPKEIAEDYKEACLVLQDSPKASAALSRRCLQNILRDAASVKHGNLYNEIGEVLNSGKLPSLLEGSMDAVRNVGNFAAHPIKSTNTGEIVEVDSEEAEWNLEVIESLFDYYYVQPAILKQKQAALNKKLNDAGKKPML